MTSKQHNNRRGKEDGALPVGSLGLDAAQLLGDSPPGVLLMDVDYLSFSDARAAIRQLGIGSAVKYYEWARRHGETYRVPVRPDAHYGSKWRGWSNFLGKTNQASRQRKRLRSEFLPYQLAKEILCDVGVQSVTDYVRRLKSGQLPKSLPATPHQFYKNDGWTNYDDFFGRAERTACKLKKDDWYSFDEARAFIQRQPIQSKAVYRQWIKSGKWRKKLDDQVGGIGAGRRLPVAPEIVYAGSGWAGWRDFFGKPTRSAAELAKYPSFEQALDRVMAMKFLARKGYYDWVSGPFNSPGRDGLVMPKDPEFTYSDFWMGWRFFLGKLSEELTAKLRKCVVDMTGSASNGPAGPAAMPGIRGTNMAETSITKH